MLNQRSRRHEMAIRGGRCVACRHSTASCEPEGGRRPVTAGSRSAPSRRGRRSAGRQGARRAGSGWRTPHGGARRGLERPRPAIGGGRVLDHRFWPADGGADDLRWRWSLGGRRSADRRGPGHREFVVLDGPGRRRHGCERIGGQLLAGGRYISGRAPRAASQASTASRSPRTSPSRVNQPPLSSARRRCSPDGEAFGSSARFTRPRLPQRCYTLLSHWVSVAIDLNQFDRGDLELRLLRHLPTDWGGGCVETTKLARQRPIPDPVRWSPSAARESGRFPRVVRSDSVGCALILHVRNRPPCVQPLHLYAGSARDNALDRERPERRRVLADPERSVPVSWCCRSVSTRRSLR